MFAFPAALVSARGLQVEADWQPLVVFPRTLAAQGPQPRTGEAFVLPAHHRSNWLAGILAGALLLVAALAPPCFGVAARMTPRLRSLKHTTYGKLLARDVAAAVSVARIRGALEDLAFELEQAGRAAAASRVRVLAWAEQEPGVGEVAALTAAIERELT
jgi:hypothetical protein